MVACPSCLNACDTAICGACGCALCVDGYRIEKVLSQKARGRVYIAQGPKNARVVLKEVVFHTVPDAQQLDAFEREADVLRRLNHPRIPRFINTLRIGEGVQQRLFLVQQLIEGTTLQAGLARGPLPETELREIAAGVLDILKYLQRPELKLIHRDIKPANLIRDTGGALWLVDFGAVRVLPRNETHRGTIVGTLGYAPPEQLGGTLDATSDLYALGATLIHLASGVEPAQLLDADLRLVFERTVRVSPQLLGFLRRLVARRRADRPQSAERALALLQAPAPLFARHPRLAVVGMALAGAVLLATAIVALRPASITLPPATVSPPQLASGVTPSAPADFGTRFASVRRSRSRIHTPIGDAKGEEQEILEGIARIREDTGSRQPQCLTDLSNLVTLTPPAACGVTSLCAHATPGAYCWKGPYLPELAADPWGNPYTAKVDAGRHKLIVRSGGPDGAPGTPDDITKESDL